MIHSGFFHVMYSAIYDLFKESFLSNKIFHPALGNDFSWKGDPPPPPHTPCPLHFTAHSPVYLSRLLMREWGDPIVRKVTWERKEMVENEPDSSRQAERKCLSPTLPTARPAPTVPWFDRPCTVQGTKRSNRDEFLSSYRVLAAASCTGVGCCLSFLSLSRMLAASSCPQAWCLLLPHVS
jgi:hypothetical protein